MKKKLKSLILFLSLFLFSLLFWWCKGFDRKKVNLGSSNLPGSESVKFKMLAWKIEDQFYTPLPHQLDKWIPTFDYSVLLLDFNGKTSELKGKIGDFTMITTYQPGYKRLTEMQKNQGPEMIERAIATNVQEHNGFLEFNLNQIQYGQMYKIINIEDKNSKTLEIFLTLEPSAGDLTYFPTLHQVVDIKTAEPMLLRYKKNGETDYLGVWFYQNKIQLPKKYSLEDYKNMDFDMLFTNLHAIRLAPKNPESSETISIDRQQKFEIEQNASEDVRITQNKEPQFLNNTCTFPEEFEVIYLDQTDGLQKQTKAMTEGAQKSGMIYAANTKIPCQSTVLYLIDCKKTDRYLPENGLVSCLLNFESGADLIALKIIQAGNTLENPSNPIKPQHTVAASSGATINNVSKNVANEGRDVTMLGMQISPFAYFDAGIGKPTQTDGTGMVILDPVINIGDGYIINLKSRDGKKSTQHRVAFRYLEDKAALTNSNLSVKQTYNTPSATVSKISPEQNNIGNGSSVADGGEITIQGVYFNANSFRLVIDLPKNAFVKVKRVDSGIEDRPTITSNQYTHDDPKTGDEITVYAEDGRYTRYKLQVNFKVNIEFATKSDGIAATLNPTSGLRFGAGDIDNHTLELKGLKNGDYILEPINSPIRKGRATGRFSEKIEFSITNGSIKLNLFQNNPESIQKFIDLLDGVIDFSFLLKHVDKQNPLDLYTFTITLNKQIHQIKNCYDLQGIKHDLIQKKEYALYDDIDCSQLLGNTAGFQPINSLEGTLNGASGNPVKRYVIKNLKITPDQDQNIALFRTIASTGKALNLTFDNPTITGNNTVAVLAALNQGTVAGVAVKGSYATNWNNTNTITSSIVATLHTIAGLVAVNEGKIYYSFVDGIKFASQNPNSTSKIGGLVAENKSNGLILGSYAVTGTIGKDQIGALVGNNSGTIDKSYAITQNDDLLMTGILVGANSKTIKNSYAQIQLGNNTNPHSIYKYISYDFEGNITEKPELGSDANFKYQVGSLVAENVNDIKLDDIKGFREMTASSTFFLKDQKGLITNTPIIQQGTNYFKEYPSLTWNIAEAEGYINLTVQSLTLTRTSDNKILALNTSPIPTADGYTLSTGLNSWSAGGTYTATILSSTVNTPEQLTYKLNVGGQDCASNPPSSSTGVTFTCTINGSHYTYKLNINILNAATILEEAKFVGTVAREPDVTIISKSSDKVDLGVDLNNRINRRFKYSLTGVKFIGQTLELMKGSVKVGMPCDNPCTINIPIPEADLKDKTELQKYKIQITSAGGSIENFPFEVKYLSNEADILEVVGIKGKNDRTLSQKASINPVILKNDNTDPNKNYIILPVFDQEELSLSKTSFTYSDAITEVKYGDTVLHPFTSTKIEIKNFKHTTDEKLTVIAEDGTQKKYTIYLAYIPTIIINNYYNIRAWDASAGRTLNRVGAGDFENKTLISLSGLPKLDYKLVFHLKQEALQWSAPPCGGKVDDKGDLLPPPNCQIPKSQWLHFSDGKLLFSVNNLISNVPAELPEDFTTLETIAELEINRERYKISNWKDLQAIDDYAGNYTIEHEIVFPELGKNDFPDTGFQTIGGESGTIKAFTGTLNGKYNVIRGFKMIRNNPTGRLVLGLFAQLSGQNAKIMSLAFDKPVLKLSEPVAADWWKTSLLVGEMLNNASIDDVAMINVNIDIRKTHTQVLEIRAGALVGLLTSGTINRSIVTGIASTSGNHTGLMVGSTYTNTNNFQNINNSLVVGIIDRNAYAADIGGVIGTNYSSRGTTTLTNVIAITGIIKTSTEGNITHQSPQGVTGAVMGGIFLKTQNIVQYAQNIGSGTLTTDQKKLTLNTFTPEFSLNEMLEQGQIYKMRNAIIGLNAANEVPLHPFCENFGSSITLNSFHGTWGNGRFTAINPTSTAHGVNITFLLSEFTNPASTSKLPIPYPKWLDEQKVLDKIDFQVEIK